MSKNKRRENLRNEKCFWERKVERFLGKVQALMEIFQVKWNVFEVDYNFIYFLHKNHIFKAKASFHQINFLKYF